jgi:elongation factor P
MKVQANQIRPGWVIDRDGRQFSVLKIKILQPGKGGAFIQVDMRDVESGLKTNDRWRTVDTVEKLMTEDKDAQYLYADGDNLVFMDTATFEQFSIPKDAIEEQVPYLQEMMEVVVFFIENKPVGITLPNQVTLTVTETEPVVKGQTAASSGKPAILENGIRFMVPPFVETGDKIVVSTSEGTYVERAKN